MSGSVLSYNDRTSTMALANQAPRVLIADDQADVREALRLLLKGEGYATHTVATPAAVLESAQTREFDVILIDLNYARDTTSGQEGLDLLSQIQSIDDTLPVVVLTSSKLQADVDKSRQLGVYDYRVKPHGFEDLVRLLDDVRKCWLEEKVRQAPG